ncbi:MAG: Holliday junction branch migration protein RuvA [Treponemataceae bacterium]|jgi:Holliday junction DNA helicase RuvA|nr:Holliday junction branch migration protein RuvA [Treponemataceae bacterium]
MFNSLFGTITAKFPQTVYLETNGIEWDISAPDSSVDALPHVGEQARVYTWLLHRDDSMKLFGFASAEDRALFLDLLKVDGVGPKGALKILSSVSADQLVSVLDGGDVGRLEKVPGVGKKTAQKMMLALKGKLTLSENTGVTRGVKQNSPYSDLILSLASMGYDKSLAEQKVAAIVESLEKDASFAGKTDKEKEEIIFRRAIVEMA